MEDVNEDRTVKEKEMQKISELLTILRNLSGFGSVTLKMHAGEIKEYEVSSTIRPGQNENLKK